MMAGTFFTESAWPLDLGLGLPPMGVSGRLGALYRQIIPDEGEDVFQQAYTAELIGQSYVWQPWFGNWVGRLAGSWSMKESSTSVDSLVLSGGGELNLFHLSRFPFQAFVDIRDSRVDVDDAADPGSEERFVRYGIRQSYRPASGRGSVHLNLFRDEREDLLTGDREDGNRLIASGFLQYATHSFNASLLASDTSRSVGNSEQFDWQADISHTYTPGPRFSMTTSLGAGANETSSDTDESNSTRGNLGSNFIWRAETLPLSLRGDLSLSHLRQEAELTADRKEDEARGSLSLLYLPSRHWRFGLDAGVRQRLGDVEELATFQGLNANYNSPIYPLGGFNYGFGAGVGARNETNSRTEDEQVYSGNLTHNLTRGWVYDWGLPVNTSLTLGQDLSYEAGGLQGDLGTLSHRLSYGLYAHGPNHSTSLHLSAYDSRNSGRNDLVTQSISLNGVHHHRLSRYSEFSLTYNVNYSRQSGSGAEPVEEDPFADEDGDERSGRGEATTLEAIYRHNRLLRVRNLRFQSRLRGSVNSLLIDDFASSPSAELLWENRLDYRIGKLEVDFRTTWVERPAVENGGTKSLLLSLNRRF